MANQPADLKVVVTKFPALKHSLQGAVRFRFKLEMDTVVGGELASVEEGAREAVRVALLGPDSPTGTFTHAKLGTLPW
jgi:hypothetical protein